MNLDFSAAMRQAAQLTRAQKLMEATRLIQRALMGRLPIAPDIQPFESARFLAPPPRSPKPRLKPRPKTRPRPRSPSNRSLRRALGLRTPRYAPPSARHGRSQRS